LPVSSIVYVLIAAHAISRLAAVFVMATLSYVRSSGKAKLLAVKVTAADLTVATVFGLLPLLLMYWHFMQNMAGVRELFYLSLSWLIAVSLIWYWWRNKIKHWLGGYTGDCLGAMQQLTELAFYLGVLAYFGFMP